MTEKRKSIISAILLAIDSFVLIISAIILRDLSEVFKELFKELGSASPIGHRVVFLFQYVFPLFALVLVLKEFFISKDKALKINLITLCVLIFVCLLIVFILFTPIFGPLPTPE